MANYFDVVLEDIAKWSIVASVTIVVAFFTMTAIRIVRVKFAYQPWAVRQEVKQVALKLPFTFSLKDSSVNQTNSFSCLLECKKPLDNIIVLLWGVDAAYLFKLINTPDWTFIGNLEDNSTLENQPYLACEKLDTQFIRTLNEEDTEKLSYEISVDTPSNFDWRRLENQYRYPLAMFIWNSTNLTNNETDICITGSCYVVHVKNDVIPKPTRILGQFIKLSDGKCFNLKSLYVMESPNEDNESSDSEFHRIPPNDTVENQTPTPFDGVKCLVCQHFPVSRAIIPCGHLCLCATCFSKVDLCPICRGAMTMYFRTRNEDYLNQAEP